MLPGERLLPDKGHVRGALQHGDPGGDCRRQLANLIERAADVTIKERRRLILAPRETPLSPIHLRNMLALAEIGVDIVPPMPAFYFGPGSLDDLVDYFVKRVLDLAGIQPAP